MRTTDAIVRDGLSVCQTCSTVRVVETPDAVTARNVAELRALRGYSVRGLSERLAELGQPLLPSGITKIEKGARRVSVAELVALAMALGVSPVRLLLPAERTDAPVQVTPNRSATWEAAWRWAVGEQPLDIDEPTPGDPRVREFAEQNRPYERQPFTEEVLHALVTREVAPWEIAMSYDGENSEVKTSRRARPARGVSQRQVREALRKRGHGPGGDRGDR